MKVLVFGTFDVLHKGHLFTLKKAKEYGDSLTVVVALDETVKQVKGIHTQHNQTQRMAAIMATGLVDDVLLGNPGDKYAVIEKVNPNVIVLGYDQQAFVEKLESELKKRNLQAQVIRITESFEPDKYKSSLLRQKK
jgi:cytidyltransferase-like protein